MTDPSAHNTPVIPGTPPDSKVVGPAFQHLCEIVARLRSPEGCPWDREQTLETIKPYTLEETYELLEAIDSGDNDDIVEELGDLLLQVILDAQIGADEERVGLNQVIDGICDKLIRRHPHVFGNVEASTSEEVIRHWDKLKQQEKQRKSIMDGMPADLPSLARAARVSDKAARVGFDFPNRAMLFDKLNEEINELACELFPDGQIPDVPATVDADPIPDESVVDLDRRARIENEIGDVLFVLANIARRWKINPEEALRQSNRKFERRFRYIEDQLAKQGGNVREATLLEMEDLYQQGKIAEKSG
jgi:uncharacterized protein YabN with tetrapyrrole methylase and pyrophosphatase domain